MRALATLPWVEKDSIKISIGKHEARFTVKDKSQFDFEKIKEVLAEAGDKFAQVKLVAGPA